MEIENSKLLILLKTFSKEEFIRFGDFVNSRFFNTSEQLIILYDLLSEDFPLFDSLDKKSIYARFYPKSEYKDKKLRDIFSRMLDLADDFLAHYELMQNEVTKKRYTLIQFDKRDLEKHFIAASNEFDKLIEKNRPIDCDYLMNKYSVFRLKREFLERFVAIGKRSSLFADMNTEMDLFVDYALFKTLEYGLFIYAQKFFFNENYEMKLLDLIVEFIDKNPEFKIPVIEIYHKMILLIKNPDEVSVYYEIKDLLDRHKSSIHRKTLNSLLVNLFNYTKIESIKGKPHLKAENFRLLKESIESGLHPKEGNYFPENSFITVVSTGLQHRDFEWTEMFMNKFITMLPPEKQKNAYSYCRSIFNYRKKNYGEALEGLAKISIDDFYYQLRVKNYQLRIYFETGDFESANTCIDTYRHFVSTQKYLPDHLRIRYLNFINFTHRLVNVSLGGNRNNLIEIERDLIEIDPSKVENRTWLFDCLKLIKN
ncbi:MAG: hypothetical protein K8I03_12150 [Ignavibacteria bacterium]|nr:hypothetical protein [Ignavibacteria bacterium]